MASVFGRNGTAGAIVVGSDDPLIVTSRTYNDQGEQGTYGQFIPSCSTEEVLNAGDRARLAQLISNNDFRTNTCRVPHGYDKWSFHYTLSFEFGTNL